MYSAQSKSTRHAFNRKVTPKVKSGKVQTKNRLRPSPSYLQARQNQTTIVRVAPGKGFKHFITPRDIEKFITLLPEWDSLSEGLNAIILDEGGDSDGWSSEGVVAVCAWEKDPWVTFTKEYFLEHRAILEKLNVPFEKKSTGYLCKFSTKQIRAFLLLHVLLHELGHHHDRMTTKRQIYTGRGEYFAEVYARKFEERIWNAFVDSFEI